MPKGQTDTIVANRVLTIQGVTYQVGDVISNANKIPTLRALLSAGIVRKQAYTERAAHTTGDRFILRLP